MLKALASDDFEDLKGCVLRDVRRALLLGRLGGAGRGAAWLLLAQDIVKLALEGELELLTALALCDQVMRLGELLLGDAQRGADLAQDLLVLGLLLLAHLLHNSLILGPGIRLVGLSSALHAILDVRLLALLSDLGLTVDQAQEVISVQTDTCVIIVSLDDFGQSLLLQLVSDKFLAHRGLYHLANFLLHHSN